MNRNLYIFFSTMIKMILNRIKTLMLYVIITLSFASAYYVPSTQSLGTPLRDSLSDEQKNIMRASKCKRKSVFITGIMIGILISVLLYNVELSLRSNK